jgi:hypothetical protein
MDSRMYIGSVPDELIFEIDSIQPVDVIQVVRGPDEQFEIDLGGIEADAAIGILAKAFVRLILDEIVGLDMMEHEDIDIEDDDE